ncbi:hypothetical protein [uncultured Luteimonas sp.]|uniref:hypothetical protein n=1 Tax=uncultured Luteimonas sp. TaxID=453144 RepID=UPI00260934F4|nr:hypothetical protein [uncultured Luteimonas sp.]
MTLSRRWFVFLSLFCALVASLVLLPGLPGDFIVDDGSNIVDNPGIRLQSLHPAAVLDAAFSMQTGGITRTLPTLTFALDHYRGGLDPATFKTTNIVIHALTTFVLAWFLRDLMLVTGAPAARAQWMALVVALIWAVHPLQVSSVLYVVQRMQTLATLFVVLSMWTYIRARRAQIAGKSGRTGWMLAAMLWAVALGCKEDAVLLPLYLLALELTVLRFQAADPDLARKLRRGYQAAALLGVGLYLLVVVPYFWSWEHYPYRDFSSYERLLTQGRVLWLYIGQILLPLPSSMPFFYDWLAPSRGLLAPWTTLIAWLAIVGLLAAAWRLRHRRPLLALGILLFFAGHFVSSNVVNLELVFEHRNHFPLIGLLLAVGDLLALGAARFRRPGASMVVACVVLIALSSATALRARSWNSELAVGETATRLAPASARAWQTLCVAYYKLGGGGTSADNPYLEQAIDACNRGAAVAEDSVANLTNVMAFKAIQGSLTQSDWDRYLQRIDRTTMTPENSSRIWVLISMVRQGVQMDEAQLLEAIDRFHRRIPFKTTESSAIGYFILGHTQQPDRAYPYFAHAVNATVDPAVVARLLADLRALGYTDLAGDLETATARPQ